jgi:glycerol-3-phosphate dehydrogenase
VTNFTLTQGSPWVASGILAVVTANPEYDLLVVGGGINGAGIARDAAGRGLKVLLCEQHDLAAHTSSASTKLIHGGLRYLEFLHFGLVRKALRERETLLALAPHIMWPLRFVMPHDAHLRPAWMIRAGLFLYDHLTRRRTLEGSRAIDLTTHPAGAALQSQYARGFVYSDGWVDDARLVVLNALDAQERGAAVMTRTRCTRMEASEHGWRAQLVDGDGQRVIRAGAVVNAAGPWAARVHAEAAPAASRHGLRLVKGSHIVVRKLFEHDHAYIFQAPDRRIVFAIPYEQDFTLIGTTDVDYRGDPAAVAIDATETRYLCELMGRYFRNPLVPNDIVWSYAGVRPLLEDEKTDARSVTRDYSLELQTTPAPMLSVFGGKITTYRALAEEAMNKLAPLFPAARAAWTSTATLPGGDLPQGSATELAQRLTTQVRGLAVQLANRWARAYGTRVAQMLGDTNSVADLGAEVAPGLYERELEYLWRVEWARSAEDVLWRRTKLGLRCTAGEIARVQAWFDARSAAVIDEPVARRHSAN